MKRKRGRKPGHKNTPRNAVADGLPKSPASPSMEENSSADETHNALVNSEVVVVVPEPAVSRPEDRITASDKPADVPFVKPKVGAVYGRVRVKLKSSRLLEPHQSSSDVQTGSDVQKAGDKVPEGITEVAVEKDTILSDGQSSEVRGSDSDKTARKVGSIKIKSRGLSSVSDTTQDRNANKVEDPPPPVENVSENKESKGLLEPKILSEQEVEVKQSSPEHHRDEKELAAALEVIKKVMKMDAAEPFNTPVDPVALGIPDYFDVIDTPMDFGTICQDLEHGNKYMNSEDVYKDVQFIWDNCTKYNSKGDYIMDLMKRVKKAFMKNWLAAGLYSDVPDNGANNNTHNSDVMLSSQEKGHPKSKSKHKRRRQGIDRHKNDCLCAVCVVTRRRKERDENWAANEDEIAVLSSNLSQQHNMEENSPVDIPSSHDATSSREPSPQTNVYRERGDGEKDKRVAIPMQLETSQPMEVDTRGNQMEDFGRCINGRPYDLLPLDSQGEGSSENLEDEEGAECKDPDKMEHHASAQPNDDSRVAHHQQEAPIETSQEVDMQDYLVPQENHLALQLCASLFPSNQRSIFRGPHSLFHRQPSSRESPIHAAVATILKP